MKSCFVCCAAMLSLMSSAEGLEAGWQIQNETSQLDGSRLYLARLESSNQVPNMIGSLERGAIIIRCRDHKYQVYVSFPRFMGTEGVYAKWKFDNSEIKDAIWSASGDGTAAFVTEPDNFFRSMAVANRVVVQGKPYDSAAVELVFDIAAPAKIIDDGYASCAAR
jgi:hypothetical protein